MSSVDEATMAATATQRNAGPGYRLLQSITERYDDEDLDVLRTQLRNACAHFPAIAAYTVTVGCRTDPGAEHSRWTPYASAEPINYFVRFPVEERPSNQTVFHELAHLEIFHRDRNGDDLPTSSEEFCSIYTVARMPPELIHREDISYLGTPTVDSDEWPGICRKALSYREDNHDYIQQAKRWLGIIEEGGESGGSR